MFANHGAIDASAGRDSCVYCRLARLGSATLQRIAVEFQTAASSKLKAILAHLPGGYVAWWKLVPDSKRFLLLNS